MSNENIAVFRKYRLHQEKWYSIQTGGQVPSAYARRHPERVKRTQNWTGYTLWGPPGTSLDDFLTFRRSLDEEERPR